MSEGKLGGYVLEERVAKGGMGDVWRARAPDGRIVCIKRLDQSLRDDVDFIEMFRDEAALVADLDHENVIRMIEVIDTDDALAQVMEFVDGASLARIRSAIPEGEAFAAAEALQIGVLLCRALHHAHTRKRDGDGPDLRIVHRDVSPQNILFDRRGNLKLVDFGVAKAALRLTRTRAGTLKGKLSYMAPEQARGDPLDHRADQYAAGILIWEMLTGKRLFGGRNELLVLEQVQKSDPVPPSSVKKSVARSVDKVVLRALRWHPMERFPDTAAFEQALSECLREIVPSGRVDLSPLVARTMSADNEVTTAPRAAAPVMKTRVLAKEEVSDDRKPRRAVAINRTPVAATGLVVAAVAIIGALYVVTKPGEKKIVVAAPAVDPVLSSLEAKLQNAPGHPCKTELLDDMLDKAPWSERATTALVDSVKHCVDAATAPPSVLKKGALDPPAWPKKKKRTPAVIQSRIDALTTRGKKALSAGEYERAKSLLAEAISLDAARIDVHPLLAQTFRGLGDPAGAAHHYRLWFFVHPDDTDRERAERYLRRYGHTLDLKPSAHPGADEIAARNARAQLDAPRYSGSGNR